MGASPRSKKSKWWPAKTLNAFTNILPSQIASGHVSPAAGLQHMKEQYEVMYDYSAAPHDPHEISFRQGDIVDFISKEDSDYWWVRKANGSVGIAPSRCLRSSGSSASTHSCRYETPNPESSVENFVMSPTPTAGAVDGEHWDSCQYRAIAAYTYNRSAPNEISFGRGEKLDVLGKRGRSCPAKKTKDGSAGIAPCNYLRIIPATNPGNEDEGRYKYKAKARWAYNSSAHDPNELSFSQGEVLDIVNKQGDWWQAKTADGRIGIAPSHYLQIELP
ncbi:hypothetical protein K438DRAFT_1838517 [Mycena galopus ATCC 62051]|nr:hypothetical protein K438DRAFT_1838517 [Mycena galopus ATCC 62051]